ncbi:MAG TPA: heavy metal translocating P-type ATPase [Vulgatibacter sp.]|nr:heavy metal translocating P-type ATPase [Vulgatibacter sp.]
MARGRAEPSPWWKDSPWIRLAAVLLGLVAGAILHAAGLDRAGGRVWAAATLLILALTLVSAARDLLRGRTGVDLIAILAMAGALALGQFLAGAIVATMLTGGTTLERYAVGRARRELTRLLERAPRIAHLRRGEGVVDVPVDRVKPGDVLVVKQGEVLPADGILVSGGAVLDESALTGEAAPVRVERGTPIRSGATNAGRPFDLQVTASAERSTYAGIVRLVQAAEASKAPFVRLADRYAARFLALTLILSGSAWIASGDAVRALAVLVVATPCPLILAAPAAIVGGVSRAARFGVIVKGGGPLEALAGVEVLLLDKTGTLTAGRPKVAAVEARSGFDAGEVVRLAASLEQVSLHPFAPALLAEAQGRDLHLSFPEEVQEEMGTGIRGVVEGRRVAVGQLAWADPGRRAGAVLRTLELRAAVEGSSLVYVAIDGEVAGGMLVHDPIRAEAPRALRELKAAGIGKIHMVTGDHPDVADLVGDALGIDRVFSERTPEEKVDVIRRVRSEGVAAMVGDGINDAPALAQADVGIAMGARGASAASEAADVVLTSDRLEGLVQARRIARRTRAIARQSAVGGMALSIVAMGFAAAGFLPPVAGAVLQEGIDVLVILNALRTLGGDRRTRRRSRETLALGGELKSAHEKLEPQIEDLATLAARLGDLPPEEARRELVRARDMLNDELLPHEREEQRRAYPVVAGLLGREDPTGPLIQTHHEIQRLARLFSRMVDRLGPGGPTSGEVRDLRRALYGLHAILTLHFSQEEEFFSLLEA